MANVYLYVPEGGVEKLTKRTVADIVVRLRELDIHEEVIAQFQQGDLVPIRCFSVPRSSFNPPGHEQYVEVYRYAFLGPVGSFGAVCAVLDDDQFNSYVCSSTIEHYLTQSNPTFNPLLLGLREQRYTGELDVDAQRVAERHYGTFCMVKEILGRHINQNSTVKSVKYYQGLLSIEASIFQ